MFFFALARGCTAGERDRTMSHEAKREPEIPLIIKTYDLVLWCCQHTAHFPRSHRFVLGERIERRLYELLETLLQAKYTRERQDLLRRANLSLEILRFQMRLAMDLQCLQTTSPRRRSGTTQQRTLGHRDPLASLPRSGSTTQPRVAQRTLGRGDSPSDPTLKRWHMLSPRRSVRHTRCRTCARDGETRPETSRVGDALPGG